nr:unnamed protein product [Callosobruchus chinensis]
MIVIAQQWAKLPNNINAGVPQGSVLAPTLFLRNINDLLSTTINPIHSFAYDSTLHAGIISNRPIPVVVLKRRRLATAASLLKDLETITAWGFKNKLLGKSSDIYSPSNLLKLYKAQIRPSLEYCSHIWGAAAPTTLSVLDAG